MMVFKRREVTIVGLALLVALAGYLNMSYKNAHTEDEITLGEGFGEVRLVSSETKEDFFEEARLDRELGRAESKETLNELIANADADGTVRANAQEQIIEMTKITDMETVAEGLIRAKGFEDAIIYITDGKVNALVKTQGLDEGSAAKIQEVITEITGIGAENIKIVEVN